MNKQATTAGTSTATGRQRGRGHLTAPRWGSVRRAAVAGVVLVGLAGAVQASPAAAEDGGNSATAHACQEGGYTRLVGVQDGQITTFGTTGECVSYAARGGRLVAASVVQPCLNGGFSDLATSEDDTTAFSSEAACVSYAAGGGTLVPVADPVDPRFTYFRVTIFGGDPVCNASFDVEGLAPSTTYRFIATFSDGATFTQTSAADAAGNTYLLFNVFTDEAVTMTVQTYDATGAVAIGSPSRVYSIGSNCNGRL